ncbi:efflux RND transporter periplasmic adaptor subunit [Sulfobacillus thermosulfidooxidans]|uniref:Barrel-sandwich domain of CusB or HlyD membrane-fusion n=2 Tax=Sulfobacillus thermosulfidooxidans TaxID=28034 RepID=A0A1W1W9D4_SULTA|nr:efflux RND transporter periplasmic adaptor subunit [Sulfobacillus thermosulfidooxidans]OLZ10918.1 secretion protein HlyD [Sulfobacillus thermosulfidooxidans]OLZ14406.1 secretion protein HlyD [Sulfobacillus thermosulfidooxidans]OLZ19149.1 secretion protein HlyD [Sulfobacillus thermosulfidooxidans]PSR28469.1 MAG: HlyD family secretion protein [Sulfobacillus thermosulfidooxidans]SMC02822.1 Barrel-sandwich domain of CusB or HlyD membrane-fusion [Sulfobacillus thermosulfidooxidans DSM 9293]
MKQSRLILINILIIVALILIGGVVAYYWTQNYDYVSTQDASISAPSIPIAAVTPGTIENLSVSLGQHVTQGQVIGQELTTVTTSASQTGKGKSATSSPTSTTVNIVAPVNGVVANLAVHDGQMVSAGTPLVTLVQLSHVMVIANIPESKIRNVSVGQSATIYVDAHPGVAFSGTVEAIQPTTQSFFSLIPTAATSGTYTKVTQRIPVELSIDAAGYTLLPGENAEVRITVH